MLKELLCPLENCARTFQVDILSGVENESGNFSSESDTLKTLLFMLLCKKLFTKLSAC